MNASPPVGAPGYGPFHSLFGYSTDYGGWDPDDDDGGGCLGILLAAALVFMAVLFLVAVLG